MESHEHDVLIIGGGGAGLRAAIEFGESYPKLRIAVISKVFPMRSHTVAAEGGAAAVIQADAGRDSPSAGLEADRGVLLDRHIGRVHRGRPSAQSGSINDLEADFGA